MSTCNNIQELLSIFKGIMEPNSLSVFSCHVSVFSWVDFQAGQFVSNYAM